LGATLFLLTTLFISLASVGYVSFMIDWPHSYLPFAMTYFLCNAYMMWNIAEFLAVQVSHVAVQCWLGFHEFPLIQCANGIPMKNRTIYLIAC